MDTIRTITLHLVCFSAVCTVQDAVNNSACFYLLGMGKVQEFKTLKSIGFILLMIYVSLSLLLEK